MSEAKRRVLELAERHVCPNRVATLRALGIDLVIGRREGYRIWDLDGRELLDFHLNGGVFNLGHRNPEVCDALRTALDELDVGATTSRSGPRAELARRWRPWCLETSPTPCSSPSGSEAVEVALKTARRATERRRIVSIQRGYHGQSGSASPRGRFSRPFLSRGRRVSSCRSPSTTSPQWRRPCAATTSRP